MQRWRRADQPFPKERNKKVNVLSEEVYKCLLLSKSHEAGLKEVVERRCLFLLNCGFLKRSGESLSLQDRPSPCCINPEYSFGRTEPSSRGHPPISKRLAPRTTEGDEVSRIVTADNEVRTTLETVRFGHPLIETQRKSDMTAITKINLNKIKNPSSKTRLCEFRNIEINTHRINSDVFVRTCFDPPPQWK